MAVDLKKKSNTTVIQIVRKDFQIISASLFLPFWPAKDSHCVSEEALCLLLLAKGEGKSHRLLTN